MESFLRLGTCERREKREGGKEGVEGGGEGGRREREGGREGDSEEFKPVSFSSAGWD